MKKILLIVLLIIIAGSSEVISQNTDLCNKQGYSSKKIKSKLKRIYIPYNKNAPHYNPNIKKLFYVVDEKKDTFHYAIKQNDSIFLWAIVRGEKIRLIKDLNGLR